MKTGILCGLAAAVSWGLSNVASKSLLDHFAPLSLLTMQLLGSNILLWSILLFKRNPECSRLESLRFSWLGLLQPGLAFSFSVFGLNLTTANSEALIWACESIAIIFLAAIILRERISFLIYLLAFCGTCGTLIATTPSIDDLHDFSKIIGNILIVAGLVCAAFYSIYSQAQVTRISPLRLTALHQLSGMVLAMVLWLISIILFGAVREITGINVFLAMLTGITAYALPFLFYLLAIKDMGAAKTSLFLILPPIFTILASSVILNQHLSFIQWIGVILSLSSVGGMSFLERKSVR